MRDKVTYFGLILKSPARAQVAVEWMVSSHGFIFAASGIAETDCYNL